MTTAEKASQTQGSNAAGIPRLGISNYQWWNEAIHGFSRSSSVGNPPGITNGTSYPVSYALGSTWNPDLYYRESTEIGREIRERSPGNNLNLTMYSPTINLARDARWGRNDESYSEDPYLTGVMGSTFVKGLEGKTLTGAPSATDGYQQAVATIKHYAANNSERNRQYSGADNVDLRSIREYYTRAYRNIIQDAGVTSVMTAYSSINGIPVSQSSYFMDTLLRQSWGFSGYITSDCDSVSTSFATNTHKQNPQTKNNYTVGEAFATSLAHGEDLECNTGIQVSTGSYRNNMAEMLGTKTDKGTFTENQLDVSVHRLMTTRMKLGEFDGNTYYKTKGSTDFASGIGGSYINGVWGQTQSRLDLAEDLSRETIVMLKNESNTLPLSIGSSDKVGVIGPIATSTFLGGYSSTFNLNPKTYSVANGGTWTANTAFDTNADENFITIWEGIKDEFGLANSDYYVGFDYSSTPFSTTRPTAANPTPAPTTCVEAQVLANNFTYITTDGKRTIPPGNTTQLQDGVPVSTLNVPDDLDVAIVVVGHGSGDSNEEQDRENLIMRSAQIELIKETRDKNPSAKIIVLMETYGPVEVKEFESYADAILWSGFNGIRKGVGFADVLSGDANPSGRTTALWHYDTNADIPHVFDYILYPNSKGEAKDGRTYMYYNKKVSYPFGYGLSYSENTYTLNLDKAAYSPDDIIKATVTVTNTNNVGGKDVVQLYAASSTPLASGAVSDGIEPRKRLVAFQKVDVPANGNITVTLDVPVLDLAYFDSVQNKYVVKADTWTLEVGAHSGFTGAGATDDGVKDDVSFTVSGTLTQTPLTVAVRPNQNGDVTGSNVNVAERVLFQKGKTVNPNLSVTMNDEDIYGWGFIENIPGKNIGVNTAEATDKLSTLDSHNPTNDDRVATGNASRLTGTPHLGIVKALPAGADVTYTVESGDPGVVSISASGAITTVGYGVVTIRAAVTYNGETASTDFVVYVTDPAPETVTVGGTPLANYNRSLQDYNVAVPYGTTTAPAVAVPPVSGLTFNVTPAASVPGTTVIQATDGTQTNEYRIHFGRPPVSVNFKGAIDPSIWSVINPDPSGAQVTAKGLELKTLPNTALPGNTAKNIYLQPAYGDWTAETHVIYDDSVVRNGQQVGLIVYGDENNYMRLGYVANGTNMTPGATPPGPSYFAYQSTGGPNTYGLDDPIATQGAGSFIPGATEGSSTGTPPKELWLRIVKAGNKYTFYIKRDVTADWVSLGRTGNVTSDAYANPRIGVFAENGKGYIATGRAGAMDYGLLTKIDQSLIPNADLTAAATFEYLTINGVQPDPPASQLLTPPALSFGMSGGFGGSEGYAVSVGLPYVGSFGGPAGIITDQNTADDYKFYYTTDGTNPTTGSAFVRAEILTFGPTMAFVMAPSIPVPDACIVKVLVEKVSTGQLSSVASIIASPLDLISDKYSGLHAGGNYPLGVKVTFNDSAYTAINSYYKLETRPTVDGALTDLAVTINGTNGQPYTLGNSISIPRPADGNAAVLQVLATTTVKGELATKTAIYWFTAKDGLVALTKDNVPTVVAEMTLADKAALVSGVGTAVAGLANTGVAGATQPLPAYGVPGVALSDGPTGVRMGSNATVWTNPTGIAATWNNETAKLIAKRVGAEAQAYGVDYMLGPALNIQRNPLGGRDFEYYSEDPYVSGVIAGNYTLGLQSEGVGATLKHYAANNQEQFRSGGVQHISERALREIYLRNFELAVSIGRPWSVMSSYNRPNGTYASGNRWLLTDVLRNDFGFDGFVMTDWGGTHGTENNIIAGNDLAEPSGTPAEVLAWIHNSTTSLSSAEKLSRLDIAITNILNGIVKTHTFKGDYATLKSADIAALSDAFANKSSQVYKDSDAVNRATAAEAMVLLKNDGATLPLPAAKSVAIANVSILSVGGGFGGGLSNSSYGDMILEGGGSANVSFNAGYVVDYKKGFENAGYTVSQELVQTGTAITAAQAQAMAAGADYGVFIISRPSSEGADNTQASFDMSAAESATYQAMIDAFHAVNKKVIVLINAGASINVSAFKASADALLVTWLPGNDGGDATLDILTGKVNPSGKLTQTFPLTYNDSPSIAMAKTAHAGKTWSSDPEYYDEGVYVGYRYFTTFNKEDRVAYPFGYGLSYTTFSFSNLKLDKSVFQASPDSTTLGAVVTVTNTGSKAGQEVVELYLGASSYQAEGRPVRELKAYAKTKMLNPGQSENVEFVINKRDLQYFNDGNPNNNLDDPIVYSTNQAALWTVATGTVFTVTIGDSSATADLKARGVSGTFVYGSAPPSGSGSISTGDSGNGNNPGASVGSSGSTGSTGSQAGGGSTGSTARTSVADFADSGLVAAWAVPFMNRLISSGIMNGYADGTLAPRGNVTRAEFTKLIVSSLQLSAGSNAQTFSDVGGSDWFKTYVDIAASLGLINGVGSGIFAPNNQISRQDLCAIVYRAMQNIATTLPSTEGERFADDSQIAAYAKDAVYALRQANIISGRDDGRFDPNAFATREETAKIICGLMDYVATIGAGAPAAASESTEAAAAAAESAIAPAATEESTTSGAAIE